MIPIFRWMIIVNVLMGHRTTFVIARKSDEKCKEYAKLVFEEEMAPVLRIDAGSNTVSKCTIVASPLIIGGVQAKPAEFPHMVVIGYGKDKDITWQCGGTIVSENYILTAAHCVDSPDKGAATMVRVGLNNLIAPEESMQERAIIERIKHPEYRLPAKYHDIALLKLNEPLVLNSRVRPACLESQSTLPGKTAIACGFGKTAYESTKGSDHLMKVQLDYVSEEDCKKSFASDLKGRQLPQGLIPNLLCAGMMEGGKDTCQGDSGGPLQRVLKEPYCMYSVVGVTSFGKFCAFKNSPAIYTKINYYLDWLESIVWP